MKVIKRNGEIVPFESEKIFYAITKAMEETELGVDLFMAGKIAEEIYHISKERVDPLDIEEIQDLVENSLMDKKRFDVAKRYIIYRNERDKLREQGWIMTDLQRDIYQQKYKVGNEDFNGFLERVSGGNQFIKKAIRDKKFLPAGRILASRGLDANVTLSNCYVVPKVEDSLESIFDTAKYLAKTYAYGGGSGLNLSKLRPNGATVQNSAKHTTGAVSFMDLYSLVTGLIGQNNRRGALMLNMDVNHPDIEEFIDVKNSDSERVRFANISVNVDDEFMRAVKEDKLYKLEFKVEATGEYITKLVRAKELFTKLAYNSWNSAEPAILYQDTIDGWHLMSADERFEFAGINPCVVGDTLIQTVEGNVPIKDLVGKTPYVYAMGEDGKLTIVQASKVWMTRKDAKLVKVITGKGEIICTPDHKIYTTNRGWVEAINLTRGDKVKGLNRQTSGHRHCKVGLSGEGYEKEHRFVARHFMDIEGLNVHHIDDDGFNNNLSNLDTITHSEHSVISNTGRKIKVVRDELGRYVEKDVKTKRVGKSLGKKVGNNWFVVEVIELDYTEDVYDMTVPVVHNFVANDMVIHNCGEEPLPAFGSCNLSAINLADFVKNPFTDNAEFDYEGFSKMVREGVIYLNEILDENMERHPLPQQREVSRDLRQIGLGIMGLADMFIKMGITYGSDTSIAISEIISHTMINEALQQSALLAKEQGTFPLFNQEAIFKSEFLNTVATDETLELIINHGLRNSQILTVAPTGSTSTMLGVSGGIEPIFQLSYTRKSETLYDNDTYYKVSTPIVQEYMELYGLTNESELPEFFITSQEINYKDRIKVQGAWQQNIDASISSTVNLPEETTVEEVADLYMLAWENNLKGITVYRDGCMREGILTIDKPKVSDLELVEEDCNT